MIRTLLALGALLLSACQPASGAPAIGGTAPDFTLPTLDGRSLSLSSLRGRPVVINFWATWCAPCREEMPLLQTAFLRYGATGLTVLAVDVQEGEALVRPFVEEFGLTFPVLLDKNGDVVSRYRVRGLPTTVFVDRAGIIQSVYLGPLDEKTLEDRLKAIVGPSS
ncbi:MAG: TlpA disulfide reductase family protein [Chloroflexota bacterium]|nr:TlpA family protein disulfide reductase [Dehalococcoidia bacterium]MDW8254428.1 TlpA disulfide reductase family protein [Chloroflexota bacterium]